MFPTLSAWSIRRDYHSKRLSCCYCFITIKIYSNLELVNSDFKLVRKIHCKRDQRSCGYNNSRDESLTKLFMITNLQLSAMEIGKHNIRVNGIVRGLHLGDAYPMTIGSEKAEKATAEVMPLRRWLDPKNDLASTVLYLVSDDSRYMTGTAIFVDGAQSLVRPRMRSFIWSKPTSMQCSLLNLVVFLIIPSYIYTSGRWIKCLLACFYRNSDCIVDKLDFSFL